MAHDHEETPPGRSAQQTAEELASGLEEQRLRVEAMSARGAGSADLATVLGEIDIAHEELRVAEDELRAQQRLLDDLLAERSDPRAWHRGLIGALPVPALLTDPEGTVVDLNASAWALLGGRRDDVVDRALVELLVTDDRRRLEETLGLLADGAGTRTVRLSVVGPDGAPTDVELVVGAEPGLPGSLLTWVASGGRRTGEDASVGLRTAEAFAEMCRLPLVAGADTRSVLARAAALVGKAVPASDGVSITLGPPDAPDTQATDDVWAQEVDGAQLRAGDGPCMRAYRTGTPTVTDDLRSDARWPDLAALAGPLGVAAVLGWPIRTDRHSLGVLNVYSRRSGAFDERDRRVADLLVSAVLAVVQETRDRNELTELSNQLREALESRAVIDQAKGILMSRNRVTSDQAFAQLVASSRRSNTKVRDVARVVVEDATRRSTDDGASDRSRPQPQEQHQQGDRRQPPGRRRNGT